jgi:hypothetical protein
MPRLKKWLTVLGCLLVCGCGPNSQGPPVPSLHKPVHQPLILQSIEGPAPEVMTLYSLDANYNRHNPEVGFHGFELVAKITPETEFFHDWPVLGKKAMVDASERQALWDALYKGIEEFKGEPASCFWPRHGIRVERNGEQTDYVICFHCSIIEIYTGDKKEFAWTSDSVQPEFNQVLTAAGIPIAPGGD